jgi:hypothetical protein
VGVPTTGSVMPIGAPTSPVGVPTAGCVTVSPSLLS